MSCLELYVKPDCPVCVRAKQILKNFNVEYIEYVVGKDITKEDVKRKFPEARVVPIIIFNGDQLDGLPELQLLLEKRQY